MAPMRRRLSKRVVKSTFQECFEYDLPGGFRSGESKRVSLPEIRNRASTSDKSKQELKVDKVSSDKNVNQVPKVKAAASKDSPKGETLKKRGNETTKVKVKGNMSTKAEAINKKLVAKRPVKLLKIKNSAANRMKTKNAFLGSDYKRFKSPQINSKSKTPISKKVQTSVGNLKEDGNKRDIKTVSEVPKNTSSSADPVLVPSNWQPVVHLEKISVDDPKTLRSGGRDTETSSRHQHLRNTSSRNPDLATRLRNALKDPLAEREDNESGMSDNEISNSMLVEEVLAGKLAPAGPSQSILLNSKDTVFGGRLNLRTSALERVFRDDVCPKQAGSDSALEDWPESSSENSEGEDAESKEENFVLDDNGSPSSVNGWSGPHVNVILHWQKKFNRVTNELRNSFDSLKSIIEEKNSLIAALKNKLDSFNDSTCHQILDRILLDYDKHDPKKPATVIINSILEY